MIGFRVDANEKIALGHLMRCITIAKGFQKAGENVIFFLAEDKETKRLVEQNIPYIILQSNWKNLEQEVPILISKIKKYEVSRLIVDSYQATKEYLERLNAWVKVIYMNDSYIEEIKEKYDITGVIHYSNWPGDERYKNIYKNSNTICMAGMEYTPLRDEFYPFLGKREKRNVLLTTGGTDPYNITGRMLEYAKEQRLKGQVFATDVHFLVIIGSMYQNKSYLETLERKNDWITLYNNVNNMGELMRKSYVAVSAGGTTIYELCACEIPIISFSFADNQENFVREMGERNILYYAGDVRKEEKVIEYLYNELVMLWKDDEIYKQYREKMRKLIDGKGVQRIVKTVLEC